MNKLYFLKGFGVGVIFCVCVLGLACAYRTSEGEIIRQARELGMVFAEQAEDEKGLVFASTEPALTAAPKAEDETKKDKDNDNEEKAAKTPDETALPSPVPSPASLASPSPSVSPSPDTKPKATKKPKKTAAAGGEKVDLQITRGMWSDAVCAALKQKGLIDDAEAFDKYLNKNGYASSIRVGTFKIPKGATYEQIAIIITSE